jgi:hypothetical protein
MSQGIPAIAMAIVASMTLIVWGYQRQLFDHSIYGMVERIQQRFQHDQRQ